MALPLDLSPHQLKSKFYRQEFMKNISFLILFLLLGCKVHKDSNGNVTSIKLDSNQTLFIPAKPNNLLPQIQSIYLTIESSKAKSKFSFLSNSKPSVGLSKASDETLSSFLANLSFNLSDSASINSLELLVADHKTVHDCSPSTCSLDVSQLLIEDLCPSGDHFVTLDPNLNATLFINKKDSTQQQINLHFQSICESEVSTSKTDIGLNSRNVASINEGFNINYLFLILFILFSVSIIFIHYRFRSRKS